ncbi:MAG: SCO family protein [Armatimonadota bacterium]|nr:SCO family protein [Armatimonadota bacterium]
MTDRRVPSRRVWLWGVVVLHVAAATAVGAWVVLGPRGVRLPFHSSSVEDPSPGTLETLGTYGAVPDFALTERSGRRVTRADLLGKVWLATFIYTQCTETCPLQTARVARLQTEFASESDLVFVSITVDPERDTPAALAAYAERYGADPARWWFLTGDKRAIYRLASEGFRLGVVDPDDPTPPRVLRQWLGPAPALAAHGSKGLVMHSSRFVLVDRQARIRAYHLPDDEASLNRLRRNLRALLREPARSA